MTSIQQKIILARVATATSRPGADTAEEPEGISIISNRLGPVASLIKTAERDGTHHDQ